MLNWFRKPKVRVVDVTDEPELETVDDYIIRHSGLKAINKSRPKRPKKARAKVLTPAQKRALRRVRRPSKPGRRGK